MWDTITAILGGRKHCGWCVSKPVTRVERFFGGNLTGPRKNHPLHVRAYWTYDEWQTSLGVWKLGQWWHFRHHTPRHVYSPEEVRDAPGRYLDEID